MSACAVPTLRYPSLLPRLLSELPAELSARTVDQHAHAIDTNGTPVTITQELLRTPPALLLAAVRSPLNNTTAGNLLEWRVHTTGPGPRHIRHTSYVVSMPTPLSARTFDLESYHLVASEMPAALSACGAVCFVSQTPLDPSPSPAHRASGSAVAGDVLFSGYLFVPMPGGCTWLRRVLAVEMSVPFLARSIERAALRATMRANHQFMDMPTAAHLAALQAIVDGDRAYSEVFAGARSSGASKATASADAAGLVGAESSTSTVRRRTAVPLPPASLPKKRSSSAGALLSGALRSGSGRLLAAVGLRQHAARRLWARAAQSVIREGRARRMRALGQWFFAVGALTRQHPRKAVSLSLVCSLAALVGATALSVSSAMRFENVADLKFFGAHVPGSGLLYSTWLHLFQTPDSYIVAACDDIDLLWGSRIPILFRGCIASSITSTQLVYFEESVQNIFPPCEARRTRSHRFVSLEGEARDFVEEVPCLNRTLSEKLTTFRAHDPTVDAPFFEVHPVMLTAAQERFLEADWRRRGLVSPRFRMRGGPFVLTTFLHSGRTAVDYHHSHMDVFLSFCLEEPKTWELINPTYHDRFEYYWSGNAIVLVREKQPAPRVIIKQERGDILYVPSWWIHKTSAKPQAKSYSINLHGMAPGSYLGLAAFVFMRILGDTEWFYGTSSSRDNVTFEGAAR